MDHQSNLKQNPRERTILGGFVIDFKSYRLKEETVCIYERELFGQTTGAGDDHPLEQISHCFDGYINKLCTQILYPWGG